MYEESKKNGDGLKMKNEEKLTSQDNDQEKEYQDLEEKHKQVLQKLHESKAELKTNKTTLKW